MPKPRLQTITEVNLKGKRVLLRATLDVSLRNGAVKDDFRLRQLVPTIQQLTKQGAAVTLVSFLGRPKGKRLPQFSLQPVATHLEKLLDQPVAFAPDCVGPDAQRQIARLLPGQVLVLENTRFHHEEADADQGFAAELAAPFDLVVFDAFAQAHRVHASTTGILKELPAVAGPLLEDELSMLYQSVERPQRPAVLVIGGAKVADKVAVIEHLAPGVDHVLVGGVVANAFLAAAGVPVGNSMLSNTAITSQHQGHPQAAVATAKRILKKYRKKIVLPLDVKVGRSPKSSSVKTITIDKDAVEKGYGIYDIGPKTVKEYEAIIKQAKTVIWNGPLGYTENTKFALGTRKIAKAIIGHTGTTVMGGGDSESIIGTLKAHKKLTHVSTGGGAMLQLLAGNGLPAVEQLLKNHRQFHLTPLPPKPIVAYSHKTNPFYRYPFLNLDEMLSEARQHKFGVAACNIRSKYILQGVLRAAFIERSPVILEIAESEMGYCNMPPQRLADLAIDELNALEKEFGYVVPVALHADHVKHKVDEIVTAAIEAGFSSMLIDQSKHPLKKNAEIVSAVVRRVHPLGISVEAEIGQIGIGLKVKQQLVGSAVLKAAPQVKDVMDFVNATNIDALAGFFGNYHGAYQKPATIAWGRAKDIAKALQRGHYQVPLVLHGTSYLRTKRLDEIEVYHRAVKAGFAKFNYGTMLSDVMKRHLPSTLLDRMAEYAGGDPNEWRKGLGKFEKDIDKLPKKKRQAMVRDITEHTQAMMQQAWHSANKAWLYQRFFDQR